MIEEITIKEIEFNSREYQAELKLRNRVLREPLGLNIYDENLEKEVFDYHLGAFIAEDLVGILVLTKINESVLRMRQVAVDEKYRNKKTGKKLVKHAESFAHNLGYNKIILHGRKDAIAFYEKLGYLITSDEFLEVNIPHYEMEKEI